MTVKQLIKKLNKMPQDAMVTISNNDVYLSGEYKVTSVETYVPNIVEICTNYKYKLWEDDDE